jgi:hypothetical protein
MGMSDRKSSHRSTRRRWGYTSRSIGPRSVLINVKPVTQENYHAN